MATIEIKVPDIGDFKDVAVIELLVKPGDTVKADQSLLTVESDKASMEIPCSHAGVVKELKVALGDKVSEGSLVLMLEVAGEASASNQAPAPVQQAPAAPLSVADSANFAVVTPNPPVTLAAPASVATSSVAFGPLEVRVPDIGDFKDVAVIEVMVKVGDTIRAEQSLITVESDKASMEIPSSAAGVIQELKVKLGDKVNMGDLLAVLQGSVSVNPSLAVQQASPASNPAPSEGGISNPPPRVGGISNPPPLGEGRVGASGQVASAAGLPPPQPSPSGGGGQSAVSGATFTAAPHQPGGNLLGLPHASPSVRKFARELGVPLNEVKGTGLKGRITDHDVQAFTRSVMGAALQTSAIAASQAAQVTQAVQAAKSANAGGDGAALGLIPWPVVDFAKFGPVERKERSRIKKISAANLLRNAIMIPAVTNHDDADITDLEAFRVSTNKENEKSGVKVTMLAFLIKACVAALKKYPEFNSSLDGDALIYKQYYHIGFAADTPNGLMVPVIKDADKKGIFQISTEMGELAKKARDGKLGPAEMTGASFTISSLGGIGGRYFTPIINAPEVAILGVCRSTIEPVWDGKAFQPRLMLPLSLTWDHRVIDGAAAARFNVFLGQILGDFRRVLL